MDSMFFIILLCYIIIFGYILIKKISSKFEKKYTPSVPLRKTYSETESNKEGCLTTCAFRGYSNCKKCLLKKWGMVDE
jgi:hypothetical protein